MVYRFIVMTFFLVTILRISASHCAYADNTETTDVSTETVETDSDGGGVQAPSE